MARKVILFLSFAVWMVGCAAKPITFRANPIQPPATYVSSESVSSRKESIELVFPDRLRNWKIIRKNPIANQISYEVELGKDLHQTIKSLLSRYYKNVLISNERTTSGVSVISITHLFGAIGLWNNSVDVDLEVELTRPGKLKTISQKIHSEGTPDLAKSFFVPMALSSSEQNAMQSVIKQLVPLIRLAYEAGDRPSTPPSPRRVKNRGTRESQIPPKITVTSHDITEALRVTEKKVQIMGRVSASSGIVEVFVNNKEAIVDSKGRFMANVFLRIGENKIEVRAMDTHENVGTKKFVLIRKSVARSLNPPQKHQMASANYHALVIGNNNYRHLQNLETARKDARAVAKILEQKYGFQVKLLLDATRNHILRALNDFRRRLTERDNFLIYYAGHGKLDKGSDRAYWLPVDARADDDTSWIIADTITSNVKRISANHILIVADSCYSGTLTRSTLSDLSRGREREQYLRKMQKKTSRTLLASGGNEPVADGGGNGHSVFAEAFLEGLKEMSPKVFSVEELFYREIKERVAGNADQTPEYHVIRNSGHDGGDFLFEKVALR